MTIKQLEYLIERGVTLVWNDPEPIKGVNYIINEVFELSELRALEDEDKYAIEDVIILINYGGGSEAQVYLHEIGLAFWTIQHGGVELSYELDDLILLMRHGLIYPNYDNGCFLINPGNDFSDIYNLLVK